MSGAALRVLTLAEAAEQYQRLRVPFHPATLHPAYVAADATRNSALQPVQLCFESQGECWLHGLHLARIPGTELQDASSPYGYGGPVSSTTDSGFVAAAWQAYTEWMASHAVVVEYVRFHPLLANERRYGGTIVDNRSVVAVDLAAQDITAGYADRLRQGLKKAQRAGLAYREGPLAPQAKQFAAYYRQAMGEIGADPFFLFEDRYFEALGRSDSARLGVCRGEGDASGAWLAACLFLDGAGVREYHLSATTAQGRALAAPSFALHQGALAAQGAGRRQMYLGGGSDARPDNPLLFFKSAFSRERLCYRTGSTVFRPKDYDDLKLHFPEAWTAHPERPIFYRKV